jgi:hypothetical protein
MNQTTPATTDGTSDAIISDFLEVVDSTAPSDTHEAGNPIDINDRESPSKIEKQLRDSGTYVADFRQ